MPAKSTLLTLVLAGLLSLGCMGQSDASSNHMNSAYRAQNQTSEMPVQPTDPAQNAGYAQQVTSRSNDEIRFRRYVEQREQAYSFEAPEEWHVQAQILRISPTLYRNWDVIVSPDGQIRIAGGMPERYVFIEPSQTTQMVGLGEGATMDGTVYVARYQDALTFAQQNLPAIAGGCSGLQITGRQERLDEAQRQQAKAQREGDWVQGAHVNAAEMTFTCQGPKGPVEGRIIASTIRIQQPGVGATWVGGIRGYLAPPSRSEDAYRIMEHIVQSQQANPEWKARQRQARMQASQQAQQQHRTQMQASQQAHQQRMVQNQASFNAHQQRMADQRAAFDAQHQSWQNNQATQDRMHDQFIGTIREETRVWDTNTGQSYDVPYGADNYYIDNTGSTILGTPGYVEHPDPSVYDQMYEGYDYEDDGNNR